METFKGYILFTSFKGRIFLAGDQCNQPQINDIVEWSGYKIESTFALQFVHDSSDSINKLYQTLYLCGLSLFG